MKFFIVFALVFATVLTEDLHSRSIHDPVRENLGRIANGKNAAAEEFKYQVGMYLRIRHLIRSWCGGSLISENWVLSAAHCTVNLVSGIVYLGSTKRLKAEKVYNFSKSDFISHPDWDLKLFKNDIALLKIPTTSESNRIGMVRIPNNNINKNVDDRVVVSGWGFRDDKTRELSNNLQYGIMIVANGSVCSERYGEYFKDDVTICVATLNEVSSCKGDSGAPAVLEGQNLQIGLFSLGYRRCTKGTPILFTRVGAFYPWINSISGINPVIHHLFKN